MAAKKTYSGTLKKYAAKKKTAPAKTRQAKAQQKASKRSMRGISRFSGKKK